MASYLFSKHKTDEEIYRALAARKPAKKSFSEYRGVTRSGNPHNPYRVSLTFRGKRFYLGQYPTELAAARAYNEAVKKIIGPLAILNEIPEEGFTNN
jgi:hypothetical protein